MSLVLTVAGSDPIGGAGVQADLKAIASMDLHGCSAITAITSQNTMKVTAILPLEPEVIASQIDAILSDVQVDAVKTGMLYSKRIARTVCSKLNALDAPLVVDPVLVAGVGDALYSEDLLETMRRDVFPLATVVTPNRREAELLIGRQIEGVEGREEACRKLADMGAQAVVLKGGHFDGEYASDLLYHESEFLDFFMPRLDRKVHGGGCTFSSFLACGLAKGQNIKDSLLAAKRRIHDSIAMSYMIGQGVYVVNPMATKQKEAMRYPALCLLAQATNGLLDRLSTDGQPNKVMHFVYALPNPQGFEEICESSWNGESLGDHPNAHFGSNGMMAQTVLAINRHDPGVLCALDLRLTTTRFSDLSNKGLDVLDHGDLRPKGGKVNDKDVMSLVSTLKRTPDLVLLEDAAEKRIVVLGKDPRDILDKVSRLLN